MDAEVPVNYVAQPSSHKNLKSLNSYEAASIEHQRKMSYILSRSREQSMQSSTTSSLVQESSSHPVNLSQAAVNPNKPFAVFSGACIGKIEGCALVSFSPRLSTAKYFIQSEPPPFSVHVLCYWQVLNTSVVNIKEVFLGSHYFISPYIFSNEL